MKRQNAPSAPNTEEMGPVFNPGKEAMTEIVAAHLERVAKEKFDADSDYWGPAAMHLLFCRKSFEECERCQEIAKKLDATT